MWMCPGKDEEITVEHVVEQLRRKVLEPLHERYGTDISDAAMRKAVEKHNEICRIISEMGEMRKSRKSGDHRRRNFTRLFLQPMSVQKI